MSLAKATIVGNLGADPEMRYTSDGDPVTSFSVAVSRRFKKKDGGDVEETTWFRVSAWGRLAEVTNEYLAKGKLVYVEGYLTGEEWTGNDGRTRFNLKIRAMDVQFLSPRDASPAGAPPEDDEVDLPW